MTNILSKLTENIEYLLYYFLILMSIFLMANNLCIVFYGNTIWVIDQTLFSMINIIIFIIIYCISFFVNIVFLNITKLFLYNKLKWFKGNRGGWDRTEYLSMYELKNIAVIENNSVMYEEYKSLNRERKKDIYSSYFYWFNIVLLIYDFILENGVVSMLLQLPIVVICVFIIAFAISVFYFILSEHWEDYTGIKKRKTKKQLK